MANCDHRMRQSTHLPIPQPAFARARVIAVAALTLCTGAASAQQSYRVRRAENFRKDAVPNAVLLASVPEGTVLQGGEIRGGWVAITLEGWIWAQSIAEENREGHDRVVRAPGGENLRATPNGEVIARLSNGCLLNAQEEQRGWVRVRRSGWMWARSLERVDAITTEAEASESTGVASASATPPGLDRAVTAQEAPLHGRPDGPQTGTLAQDAPVRVLARSGEWVRVQTEGWVRESDLKVAAPGVLVGVSAAEVRSRPKEFEGQLVQWTLQYISLQEADELRRDIPTGRKYLLARGPLPEAGFVYVVVTDEQVAQVERLPPLAQLLIIGRVRVGRSSYLGNPILDLVDLAVREG